MGEGAIVARVDAVRSWDAVEAYAVKPRVLSRDLSELAVQVRLAGHCNPGDAGAASDDGADALSEACVVVEIVRSEADDQAFVVCALDEGGAFAGAHADPGEALGVQYGRDAHGEAVTGDDHRSRPMFVAHQAIVASRRAM
jgi:hypothetical protein